MQFAPLYPLIHQVLKPLFPDCLWEGDRQLRTIALTFDDGPHPEYTPRLLKILEHYAVPASFFCLGACVARSPNVTRDLVEQGHWIGLHGYDHRSFPQLSIPELYQSLSATQDAIAQACGLSPTEIEDRIRDVRPPNGFFTPQILQQLRQWDYRPVMWSVVPEDWVRPGISTVLQRVLRQVRNGSLIVLHDGICGGPDVTAITADLIPYLLDQGYQFVTVEHLWQQVQTSVSLPDLDGSMK